MEHTKKTLTGVQLSQGGIQSRHSETRKILETTKNKSQE